MKGKIIPYLIALEMFPMYMGFTVTIYITVPQTWLLFVEIQSLNLPHVDMEGIILIDFKASGPNTIGNIHQSDT